MADVKAVRGKVAGVTVETSAENAARLGDAFEAEKTPAKKAASSSKSEK